MNPRPQRQEALALAAEVGQREAARRLGVPPGTIARWSAEAKQTPKQTPKHPAAAPAAPATPATSARADELRAQIRKFDGLTAAAYEKNQMSASVSAAAKATALREELARLEGEASAADLDPVERLEAMRDAAAKAGSWTAAAQIGKQIDEARADSHDRRDEVLAWLREVPARNANDAAKHFGIPSGTIRSWKKRERDERPRGELTLLDRPAPSPEPDEVAKLAELPAKELTRIAIARRLARLAMPVQESESVAESARIVASLVDRRAGLEALEEEAELDPTTTEGRAALLEALASFPADLLAEAAGKRAG